MRMVLIVFRRSLESEIVARVKHLGIRAYTTLPEVLGLGEAGTALDTFEWPGANTMILVVLDKVAAEQLVAELKLYHDDAARRQHGAKIPLRVFVLPCSQAI